MSNSSCSSKSSLLSNPSPVSQVDLSENMSTSSIEGSHVSSMSSESTSSSMASMMSLMSSLLLFTWNWDFGHLLFNDGLGCWGIVCVLHQSL